MLVRVREGFQVARESILAQLAQRLRFDLADTLAADGEPLAVAGAQRDRILCLSAHGGLTGMPQVSIPGSTVDGLPIGLSIIGGRGTDATLVAVAAALAGG